MDKIVCVGKNYAEHARELGDEVPERPVLFLKPPSVLRAVARNGETISLYCPTESGAVHYECEIVLQLGRGGYRVHSAEARGMIAAVTLGLDMTLRDKQGELKRAGHPWTVSKVFPDAAVVGPWLPIKSVPTFEESEFRFSLNGVVKQKAQASEMIFSPAECIAYISEFFPLLPGDLIFTGTPVGVSTVTPGDVGKLQWEGLTYSVEWVE